MRTALKLQVRSVYGRDLIYPCCPQSRLLADLAGVRTLSAGHVATIEKLGFRCEYVPLTPDGAGKVHTRD